VFQISDMITHLVSKFKTFCLPQGICIDESFTLWMGCLSFKQYLPLKSQFRIKTFEICKSCSGYLWFFIVYVRNETVFESTLISEDTIRTTTIVLKLSKPLNSEDFLFFVLYCNILKFMPQSSPYILHGYCI
jgi:hypothetical protein